MAKHLLIVAASILGLIHPLAAFGGPTLKIMCLGDSITLGTTAGGYRDRLCSNLMAAKYAFTFVGSSTSNSSSLLDANSQTRHEGHGGYKIAQIESNLDGDGGGSGNNGGYWLAGVGGRAALYPDIVLLQIGTNDIRPSASTESIVAGLNSLIGHIFADRPNTKLIVASLPPTNYPESETYDYEAATVAVNALIPGIVSKYASDGKGIYFLDMHSKLATSDIADYVHPNQAGYDKMADAWFGAIKAVPEPGSMALLGSGLAAGLFSAWRRLRKLQ